MAGRRELVQAISERYRAATRADRHLILDEFVAVTGYHRKHAIRILAGDGRVLPPPRRVRGRLYDEAVREALVVLWEASDRVCGKRLKPLAPILLDALERFGHLQLAGEVRTRLLAASAATIDRLLAPTRAAVRGDARGRASAKPAVRRQVPIRTFSDWNDPIPGFMEADLVSHGGESAAGSFVHTLTLTDIASGWTECAALVVREATVVVDAVARLRLLMPISLLGLDTDNGSEFLNETMLGYCRDTSLVFTRSRPYRKNDQAWVEQKNGAVVRRLIGYGRLVGLPATKALTRLYAASRLFVNFFQPSFKLASKTRVGARVTKRYHPPATPCSRLLAAGTVPEAAKNRLRAIAVTLDPLRLLDEIRTMQHHLAKLASGETTHILPATDAALERFLASLSTAWQGGEVRPTHRSEPSPRRDWRTREDPFDAVWQLVCTWLLATARKGGKAVTMAEGTVEGGDDGGEARRAW